MALLFLSQKVLDATAAMETPPFATLIRGSAVHTSLKDARRLGIPTLLTRSLEVPLWNLERAVAEPLI